VSELFKLTPKLHCRRSINIEVYTFWCPACKEGHDFATRYPNFTNPWQFNGNIEQPIFSPSLLMNRHKTDYQGCGPRCHLVLTDGVINYQGDCEHEFAGKAVEMVDIPEGYGT
jgi:hypothetical protein